MNTRTLEPMSPTHTQLLAFAIHEIRLLLGHHLGSGDAPDPAARAAAHLAYALHNQADTVLQGGTFDMQQALGTIDAVDRMLGTRFQERLFQVTALSPPTPEPRG
ncbi:hypothetical protein [Stenotrophomonas sp.]|uniref:hypothetical protein n=1 Tax=Stenotrophomonas sp. TaxID=69392 RepID=UPI0028B1E197|nr:hypothetical protein [Stenotrophomonas sp.]